jgi:hypothetical protein
MRVDSFPPNLTKYYLRFSGNTNLSFRKRLKIILNGIHPKNTKIKIQMLWT